VLFSYERASLLASVCDAIFNKFFLRRLKSLPRIVIQVLRDPESLFILLNQKFDTDSDALLPSISL
jgi:hypothetical protein